MIVSFQVSLPPTSLHESPTYSPGASAASLRNVTFTGISMSLE